MLADKMNQLFLTHERNDYSFLKKKKVTGHTDLHKITSFRIVNRSSAYTFFKKKNKKKIGTQFVYEIT